MYGNHFTFKELVVTETGLDNPPATDSHLANLASLWDTLNYIREKFGEPIIINSAYRSVEVYKLVGGVQRSLHLQGRAADIRPKNPEKLEQLWKLINEYDDKYGLSQKIKYGTFIHIAI